MEEAARGLGQPPWRVMTSITLPLAGRGMVAGAALVFLTTMKELPATLILSPAGFHTLASRTWSASSEARFGEAAGPALLLVAISAVALVAFRLGTSRTGRPSRALLPGPEACAANVAPVRPSNRD